MTPSDSETRDPVDGSEDSQSTCEPSPAERRLTFRRLGAAAGLVSLSGCLEGTSQLPRDDPVETPTETPSGDPNRDADGATPDGTRTPVDSPTPTPDPSQDTTEDDGAKDTTEDDGAKDTTSDPPDADDDGYDGVDTDGTSGTDSGGDVATDDGGSSDGDTVDGSGGSNDDDPGGETDGSTDADEDDSDADEDDSDADEDDSDSMDLGGRRIVGEGGYETVAAAWADADDGDTIYVHSSYDAGAAGESFPIELDYREKEVALAGGHPSASVIDAGDSDANVVEIVGTGSADFRNSPFLKNLKIVGGNVGVRVRCAPFGSFENLVVVRTDSHGVLIDSHPEGGTFGTNWVNLQTWNCGGDGLRTVTSASPHGTTLWGCRFTANRGAGVRFRGTACKMVGGVSQLNDDHGLETRSGYANHVWNAYIEGNSRGNDFPVEVYANGSDGLTIENCYFHGITPRGAEHDHARVQRAVTVHDTEKLTVRDCVGRRYGDGFLAVFGCTDTDVYAGSHHLEECELFARDPTGDGNRRTRSHGAILPTDLSDVDGAHEYDRGIHLDEGGTPRFAEWRGGNWRVSGTTPL